MKKISKSQYNKKAEHNSSLIMRNSQIQFIPFEKICKQKENARKLMQQEEIVNVWLYWWNKRTKNNTKYNKNETEHK